MTFRPPETKMFNMSPNGMIAKTRSTVPAVLLPAVRIMVSTASTGGNVPDSLESKPRTSGSIGRRRPEAKTSQDPFWRRNVETTDHDDPDRQENGNSKWNSDTHKNLLLLLNLAML